KLFRSYSLGDEFCIGPSGANPCSALGQFLDRRKDGSSREVDPTVNLQVHFGSDVIAADAKVSSIPKYFLPQCVGESDFGSHSAIHFLAVEHSNHRITLPEGILIPPTNFLVD